MVRYWIRYADIDVKETFSMKLGKLSKTQNADRSQ